MPVLMIEYPIKDFTTWKKMFDRDPIHRRELGVRRHTVFRPADANDNTVLVELEFDTREAAENGHMALEELWSGGALAPVLDGTPSLHLVDKVEEQRY